MVVPSLITPIQLDTRPARAPLGSEMVQDYQLVQARELVLSCNKLYLRYYRVCKFVLKVQSGGGSASEILTDHGAYIRHGSPVVWIFIK